MDSISHGQADRVRRNTADSVNARLDAQAEARAAGFAHASAVEVSRRLAELDREWDVERALETIAPSFILAGIGLSRVHDARWLLFSATVAAFLLQHGVQGWCPPLPVLRRLGFRTRREIEREKTAVRRHAGLASAH